LKPLCEQIDPFTVTSAYNSHRPMLKAILQAYPIGRVIELGMGDGSTQLISDVCKEQGREFISYENNPEWYAKMAHVHDVHNSLKFVSDWGKIRVEPCVVLFVDHAPAEQRKIDIEKFKDKAEIIIVHDSEDEANYVYGLKEILSLFKYRIDIQQKGMPRTTAVSNTIDITGILL